MDPCSTIKHFLLKTQTEAKAGKPSPLHIGINTWQWQNEFVHGKNLKEKHAIEWQVILDRIHKLYSNPPSLLQCFPAITEILQSTRIWKDARLLLAWLWILDQQIIITTSKQQRDLNRYKSLSTRFMVDQQTTSTTSEQSNESNRYNPFSTQPRWPSLNDPDDRTSRHSSACSMMT